jgi:hypothetical protein
MNDMSLLWCADRDTEKVHGQRRPLPTCRHAGHTGGAAARVLRVSAGRGGSTAHLPRVSAGRQWPCTFSVSRSPSLDRMQEAAAEEAAADN